MSYYNWDEIVKKFSDNDLKRVLREKYNEHKDKVNAVVDELIKRGLLSSDKKELLIPQEEDIVLDIEKTRGKTKSNRKQAKFVILLIGIVLILNIGSMISSIMVYNLLTGVKEGLVVSKEVATNNDNREMIFGIAVLIAYAISSILFLIWFYRAYNNLGHRVRKVEYSTGWSIGAWFVPIISFFRPFNIMNELNDKTDLILKQRNITTERNKNSPITLWWGLFIVTLYISRVVSKFSSKADTIDSYILNTSGEIFISAVGIILSFVTIIMIKNFAEKEEILYESEKNTTHRKDYTQ